MALPLPSDLVPIAAGLEGLVGRTEPPTSGAWLAGDASTRRFARLGWGSGPTVVVMVLESAFDPASHPQVLVGKHLERTEIPVPAFLGMVPERGLLLYEDLGDVQLQDVARAAFAPGAERAETERLYRDAIGIIARLQKEATQTLPPAHPSAREALDEARFSYEMAFFKENYVERWLARRLEPAEGAALDRFLGDLAREASAGPRVLCHRDFHARNLMVTDGRLRVIDFQDARMGPPEYDLASLVRDAYVAVPDALADRLVRDYATSLGRGAGSLAELQERLDIVGLQRNIKALGTFGYMTAVRGKPEYSASIAPTWRHALRALERLPRWRDAEPLLRSLAEARPA